MFGTLGRRLALFNIAVVVTVVAFTGLATWALLRQSLNTEANSVLEDRIDMTSAALGETPDLSATSFQLPSLPGHDDDHDDSDLLKSGDVLVFIMDKNGRVISSPSGLEHPSPLVPNGINEALHGRKSTRTLTIDGERVRVRTEPIEHDDRIYGVIQALRSERQHQEELRLVGLVSLFGVAAGVVVALPAGFWLTRRAMRPIENAFHRQRAFVADASHELRTPLALLRANTELLMRSPDLADQEREEELRAILDEIDGMTHLVTNLLDLSRVDATPRLTLGETPVRPVVSRIVDDVRPLAKREGLTLTTDIDDVAATANADILGRILRILAENAIAYTPAGGTVHISATVGQGEVQLAVRDTGPGIPANDIPLIFDRFYRGQSTRHEAPGAGLGLAIAKALVQALRGSITVKSQEGLGATFTVTLPRA